MELVAADAITMPTKIMRRFVESVEDGYVRRELSDDCILQLFSRSAKGVTAVTGCVRTQITRRYKHLNFVNAAVCGASLEMLLNIRYARSFDVLRRRLNAKKSPARPVGRLRAESDDDEDDRGVSNLLATPQRATIPLPASPPTSPSMELTYIESLGVLEALHNHDDGGLNFGTPCEVKIILGYRCEQETEICLVLYEKLSMPISTRVRPRTRCVRTNCYLQYTDDEESEDPDPRGVRRALFGEGSLDSDEEKQPEDIELFTTLQSTPSPKTNPLLLTPRKRQHAQLKDSHTNSKRSMRF